VGLGSVAPTSGASSSSTSVVVVRAGAPANVPGAALAAARGEGARLGSRRQRDSGQLAADLLCSLAMSNTSKTITTSELRHLRSAKTDMLLVDVLAKEQFAKDHIEGAKNVPFDGADFLPSMARAASNKSKKIVVYGAGSSGSTSSDAAKALTAAGYTDVHTFEGGLAEWRSAEKGARSGDDKATAMHAEAGAKATTGTSPVDTGGSMGAVHEAEHEKARKAGGK
jgi:rhodanese-related sulfurtransferase